MTRTSPSSSLLLIQDPQVLFSKFPRKKKNILPLLPSYPLQSPSNPYFLDRELHRHHFSHHTASEPITLGQKEAGNESISNLAHSGSPSLSTTPCAIPKALQLTQQSYGKLKVSDSSIPGPQDTISIHTADTDTTHDLERDHDFDNDSTGSYGSDGSITSLPSLNASERTVDQHSSTFSMTSDRSIGLESASPTQDEQNYLESACLIPPRLGRHPTEMQIGLSSLHDSSDVGEITSVSMPDLTVKLENMPVVYLANVGGGKEESSSFVSFVSFEALRGSEDEEESGGLVSRSGNGWDERGLLRSEESEEEERRKSPFVQTLRPVQVRHMPMWFHILMILSISMIGFGSYAGYDAVAAVQEALMKDMILSPSQFSLLYSVYAFPNIILVIFGGKLVDIWGSHIVGLITTASIVIGASLVAIAPSLHFLGWHGRFGTMLIGRFIFGVGAESSYVVQNSLCVKWFFGPHLATAMAITVAFTRLGSICSFLFAPSLAAKANYTLPLWAAAGACLASLLSVFAYMLLRSYAHKNLLNNNFDANSLEIGTSNDIESPQDARNSLESIGIELQAVSLDDDSSIPLDSEELDTPIISSGNCLTKELKVSWHHIRNFSSLFWGCAFLGMFTYGISLGFRAVSSESIATRYSMTPTKANLVLASIDITGLFASPVIGWLVDYTYQMGWITMAGNVLSVLTFVLLLPLISPYPATILLGISSTIVPATIYPAISYMIPPSLEGFAFGITSSVINTGNLILNHAISRTLDAGWFYMCFFLIFLSILSVAITLWWVIKDSKSESPILNRFRDWAPERRWLQRHIPCLFP